MIRIPGLGVLVIFGGAKPVWVERTEQAPEGGEVPQADLSRL